MHEYLKICITSAKSFTFFNAAAACWSWGSNDVTLSSWFGLAQFWRQKLGCYEICCISCREVRWFSTLYIHFVDSCRGESANLESFRVLKLSKSESFMALKLSNLADPFRALKLSNLATGSIWEKPYHHKFFKRCPYKGRASIWWIMIVYDGEFL